jgi:copper chaperone NosL
MSHSTPAPRILAGTAPFGSTDAAPATPRSARPVARWTLSALALVAIAASYWQPFWTFKLYAPQYPSGLTLTIALTGFSGDVREIDMLNHYIGMDSLQHGAALERQYAAPLVGVLVGVLALLAMLPSRRSAVFAAVIGAAYPLGFLADTFYWLHRFGHQLDPRAPLHIPQFTPQLFGNGNIGQFMTFAVPRLGFGLSILGAVLLLGAAVVCVRTRQEGPCRAR